MNFSGLAASLPGSRNPLYVLLDDLRAKGRPIVDLVKGNVNEHGIVFPPQLLDEILKQAAERARVYRPDPFGQEVARRAIAEYYGAGFPMQNILITPGTSVSYWYCFKLLAEAGDEILTPHPSYPLFDYIAKLCDVKLTHYRLAEKHDWIIDLNHLESEIGPRTRAIVLISPHNPTGAVASHSQLAELCDIAARHDVPIIADEVFSEFLFGTESYPRALDTRAPLVFTLNGFSKMFALPGMKIGWMAVSGNDELVQRSMAALELISDTFLPVNEIAQFAAPEIFRRGQPFLRDYKNWIAASRNIALKGLEHCSVFHPRGGFYVTLKVDGDEDALAMRLLAEQNILVHPGYFYDIEPNHLVMTFIHEPDVVGRAFKTIGKGV